MGDHKINHYLLTRTSFSPTTYLPTTYTIHYSKWGVPVVTFCLNTECRRYTDPLLCHLCMNSSRSITRYNHMLQIINNSPLPCCTNVVYTQNQQNYVYKLFLPRCKLLCSAVVLQYGAHVITAWGRCETVQKQQSGIPVQPLNVNYNDGNLHFLIHLACGGHHKQ